MSKFHKNSKNWDAYSNYLNCPRIRTARLHDSVICPEDADGMANS